MKCKFGLLHQIQLAAMGLLPILIGCKKHTPDYEPKLIPSTIHNQAIGKQILQFNTSITKESKPYATLWSVLDKCGIALEKDLKYIGLLLEAIGWSKDLTLDDSQNQSSSPTLSKPSNNRFIFFFEKKQKNGAWYEEDALLEQVDTITRSNPIRPNSKSHTYAFVGCVVNNPANNDAKHHIISLAKEGKKWYAYNEDGTKADCSTQTAIELASKPGTILFYQKIE